MRSAGRAIGWEFGRRHRWGLIALAGYLLALATIKLLIPGPSLTFNMDSGERFGVVVMAPLTTTFLYVLTVFSFGLSGDVAGRPSLYPARMFTLPVSTSALALWPMLYGSAIMVLLWLATRFLSFWPSGFDIPVIWPAVAAVSLLAWTQALTWLPYGLPGLRVIAAVLWLGTMDSIVVLALRYNASEPVMVAILAPQIPLAYVAARIAVARARRGDVPDWRGVFARGATIRRRPLRPFASAARAHAWFEWRRHGRSLPALLAILLPFELALLWTARDVFGLTLLILLGVLFTPVLMGAFVAATVGQADATPFIRTRPLTDAELIAAKLKATLWSTLATWLLVLVAILVALAWSGSGSMVIERARRAVAIVGMPRAVVLALLLLAGFIVATWRQLVQSMYIGLTGRAWLIKGSVFVALAGITLVGPIVQWIVDHALVGWLWSAIPLVLAILAGLKLAAAAWIATRLHRARLLSERALVTGAAWWLAAVLALHGVLLWLLSTPHIPSYLSLLVAVLAVPLARLSAAPLALDWNRHR